MSHESSTIMDLLENFGSFMEEYNFSCNDPKIDGNIDRFIKRIGEVRSFCIDFLEKQLPCLKKKDNGRNCESMQAEECSKATNLSERPASGDRGRGAKKPLLDRIEELLRFYPAVSSDDMYQSYVENEKSVFLNVYMIGLKLNDLGCFYHAKNFFACSLYIAPSARLAGMAVGEYSLALFMDAPSNERVCMQALKHFQQSVMFLKSVGDLHAGRCVATIYNNWATVVARMGNLFKTDAMRNFEHCALLDKMLGSSDADVATRKSNKLLCEGIFSGETLRERIEQGEKMVARLRATGDASAGSSRALVVALYNLGLLYLRRGLAFCPGKRSIGEDVLEKFKKFVEAKEVQEEKKSGAKEVQEEKNIGAEEVQEEKNVRSTLFKDCIVGNRLGRKWPHEDRRLNSYEGVCGAVFQCRLRNSPLPEHLFALKIGYMDVDGLYRQDKLHDDVPLHPNVDPVICAFEDEITLDSFKKSKMKQEYLRLLAGKFGKPFDVESVLPLKTGFTISRDVHVCSVSKKIEELNEFVKDKTYSFVNLDSNWKEKVKFSRRDEVRVVRLGEDGIAGVWLKEKVVLKILHDLLSGVCHLYDNKIAHRDIKPDNLFINWKGNVVVADFGRHIDVTLEPYTEDFKIKDKQSSLGGAGTYRPSEIKTGAEIKDFSKYDIYSAGLCMWWIMQSRRYNKNEATWRKSRRFDERCGYSQELQDLVKEMCCKDFDERIKCKDALKRFDDLWGKMTVAMGDETLIRWNLFYADLSNESEGIAEAYVRYSQQQKEDVDVDVEIQTHVDWAGRALYSQTFFQPSLEYFLESLRLGRKLQYFAVESRTLRCLSCLRGEMENNSEGLSVRRIPRPFVFPTDVVPVVKRTGKPGNEGDEDHFNRSINWKYAVNWK